MQSDTIQSTVAVETSFVIEGQHYSAKLFSTCQHLLFAQEGCDSLFQSRAYHLALESAPPERMQFWYVRIEKEGRLAGMLCFQVKDFNPGDSLKKHASGSWARILRYKAASLIHLKVLCLGNTLVTGDYGFCFQSDIEMRVRTMLMMQTIDWMLTLKIFKRIALIFVKDFFEDIFRYIPDSSYCQKYHPIDTQHNMIMQVDPSWKGLDGYLASLKSKYRVRANKALEVASGLERVELSYEEIIEVEEQLHALYLKVVDDAGFNLFILSKGYFSALKRDLGDRFKLWVYKDKGEIISFFTVLEDEDILDAHFLGYDPEINHHYKLYLNMLLSMIGLASSRGFRRLQLSRTATEIKSSVGADGISMWAYLRAPNRIFNWLVPRLYAFFKPDLEWVPRQPFRE